MRLYLLIGAACIGFVAARLLVAEVRNRWFRSRGRRIERRAVDSLRLPKGWTIKANVPVPGLGDCDCLIIAPNNKRYAVEVKSSESVKKVWFRLFSKDEIRRGDGARFHRDFIGQVLRVSHRLDAIPVLWMPRARRRAPFRSASGVLVVQGGRKCLEKAIGARMGFLWF